MRRARPLSAEEWERRARPVRDELFVSLDAFEEPFATTVSQRALLFPISRELEKCQFAALQRAARAVGDDTLFLELLAYAEQDGRYWEIPVGDEDPYAGIEYLQENVIFSSSGQWGFLISNEDHAVGGGRPDFMKVVADEFPPTEEPTQHVFAPATNPLEDLSKEASFEDKLERIVAESVPIEVRSGAAFGDEQALAFIEFWKMFRKAAEVEWLPGLLTHIYGEQRAEQILRRGRW